MILSMDGYSVLMSLIQHPLVRVTGSLGQTKGSSLSGSEMAGWSGAIVRRYSIQNRERHVNTIFT